MAEPLLTALRDPRADVRRAALLAAPPEVPQDVRAAIVGALADPAWPVREAAVAAVGRLPNSDGALQTALVRITLADPEPLVRTAAAVARGVRIAPEGDYGEAVRHTFERQRIRAASALGHVRGESVAGAVTLLARLLTDSHPKVRFAALDALARLEASALVPGAPQIVRRCAESEVKVASAARRAWARLLTSTAAAVLLPLAPYPGTDNVLGLQITLDALSAAHPLRAAFAELPLPPEEATDAPALARHLARVCARVLNLS